MGWCGLQYPHHLYAWKFWILLLENYVFLCLLGTGIVFSLGVAWLSYLIGFEKALMSGVLPFILPGLVKAGLLCTALQILRHYQRG